MMDHPPKELIIPSSSLYVFMAGQSMYASMVFSFISFMVAVPSAKVFQLDRDHVQGLSVI